MRPAADIHGVLLLDKPQGLSSNAALQRARRLLGWPKAGHTGTLDPLATGLLPLCFGDATRYSQGMLDADKTYEATVRLGFTSTTGDAEGVIEPRGRADVAPEHLAQVLSGFVGERSQLPPMHSALKKDGRPLYEYARSGEVVPREPRRIVLHAVDLLAYDRGAGEARIRVTCSKGTYIRVLAEDIGAELECGGYLLALRRLAIGPLDLGSALTLDQLENLHPDQRLSHLKRVDCLLDGLPELRLDAESARRVCTGLPGRVEAGAPGPVRLYGPGGSFLGVGEVGADRLVVPKRMISHPEGVLSRDQMPPLSP
jgi:tRNA pseudouridine55 synthase